MALSQRLAPSPPEVLDERYVVAELRYIMHRATFRTLHIHRVSSVVWCATRRLAWSLGVPTALTLGAPRRDDIRARLAEPMPRCATSCVPHEPFDASQSPPAHEALPSHEVSVVEV